MTLDVEARGRVSASDASIMSEIVGSELQSTVRTAFNPLLALRKGKDIFTDKDTGRLNLAVVELADYLVDRPENSFERVEWTGNFPFNRRRIVLKGRRLRTAGGLEISLRHDAVRGSHGARLLEIGFRGAPVISAIARDAGGRTEFVVTRAEINMECFRAIAMRANWADIEERRADARLVSDALR